MVGVPSALLGLQFGSQGREEPGMIGGTRVPPHQVTVGGVVRLDQGWKSDMGQLTRFLFEGMEVRSVVLDGEMWSVGVDLAKVLGFRDAHTALRGLDEDERGTQILCTPGGDQQVLIVNESGLYHLLFMSKKSEARRFRRKVTQEILPSIRRTGHYQLPMVSGNALNPSVLAVLTREKVFPPIVSISEGFKDGWWQE